MSNDEDTRSINTRRRNILFLVHKYMQDNGFYASADALKTEAHLATTDYEVCDNIDLDSMYLEFGSYYQLKFGKFPRILRKIKPLSNAEVATKRVHNQMYLKQKKREPTIPTPTEVINAAQQAAAAAVAAADYSDLQVTVTKLSTDPVVSNGAGAGGGDADGDAENSTTDVLAQLQAMQHFTNSSFDATFDSINDEILNGQDWQHLVEMVRSTIMRNNFSCRWNDIYGNTNAIETIKEAVVMPIKFPKIFAANELQPWRSVLLHGPPGSGKTLMAKALYAETREMNVTFFNITSSIIISKWRGDSEKILRIIFRLARKHAPSIIFLDEIESLTSRRDRPTDHESSKRLKNELLQLLDGMENQAGACKESPTSGIFILASTNIPWDIDEAFLRRFEKKLLVQLPNKVERMQLIKKLLPPSVRCSEEQLNHFAKISDGFTGDEIRLACKEISMQQVRRFTRPSENQEETPLEAAFERIRPLSEKLMSKHVEWNIQNGS